MRSVSGAIGALKSARKFMSALPGQNVGSSIAIDGITRDLSNQSRTMLLDEVSKLTSPADIIEAAASIQYYAKKLEVK